jgi:Dullard-like phosphatase family protein
VGKDKLHAYIKKRPGVDEFLAEMSELYEVVVYTAALSLYANPILDQLDPNNYIQYRLFRNSCVLTNERIVKDLSRLGRDLDGVIIIDNSPACYGLQPENGIPISTWTDDMNDIKLSQLVPLLRLLATVEDVRSYLMWLVTDDNIDYEDALEELKEDLKNKNEDEVSLDDYDDANTLETIKDYTYLLNKEPNTFRRVRKSLDSSNVELRRIKQKLNLKNDKFEILSVSFFNLESEGKGNRISHPMYSNVSNKNYELTNKFPLPPQTNKKIATSRAGNNSKTTTHNKLITRRKEAIVKHINNIKGIIGSTNELYKYSRMNRAKRSTETLNSKKFNTSLSEKRINCPKRTIQLPSASTSKNKPTETLTLKHSQTQANNLLTIGEIKKNEGRYSLLKGKTRTSSKTPAVFI